MPPWIPNPYAGEFHYNASSLKKHWARLHASDRLELPAQADVLNAWLLFHNGEFERAVQAGLSCGAHGQTVANKAASVYATHLEPREQQRLALFQEVAQRAERQIGQDPHNPHAWYWLAYALGQYSQGISVAKALAQGLGTRVREALEKTIQLQPLHADAHIALGAFHAEVIDKVGSLIGSMTYGAKKEVGMRLYQTAISLNPHSAIAMVEYGNALLMMDGDKRLEESRQWYQKALAVVPADAAERLDQDLARAELADPGP